jgi:hypothetical protein
MFTLATGKAKGALLQCLSVVSGDVGSEPESETIGTWIFLRPAPEQTTISMVLPLLDAIKTFSVPPKLNHIATNTLSSNAAR